MGWHSTYHRGLSVTSSAVTVTRADGRQDIYTKIGSSYVPDPDVTNVLTSLPETGTQTGWQLKLSDDSTEKYDLTGHLTSITTRAGLTTTLTYDASSQITTVTGPFGHKLAFTYDTSNRVSTMTVPDGGRFIYGYDGHGNLASVLHPDNTTRRYLYQNTTYPDLLTGLIEESGNLFASWTYDSQGRATSSQHAGGADQLSTFTSYDADGKLLSTTDPNKLVTAFTYDQLGRVLTRKVGSLTRRYAYAPPGMVSLVTQPDGSAYRYIYDAVHRLTQITDKAGDAIDYSYDATSNLAMINVYDPSKTLTYTHSYTYDAGNRLASDTGAMAAEKTTYVYDNEGNLLTRTDPLGHVSTYTYDALNRRISFLDPLHNKTNYTYNENDDLTAVIDPRGLETICAYDGLDDQTSVRSPDTGTTTRTFDVAGNVLTLTDARDKVGTYKYDALGRPLTITWTGGETITHTYDTGTYGVGHLAKVVDPSGTTSFTYNQLGQVLTKTQVAGPVTLTVTYAYNAFDRLSTLEYPSGKLITYSYDSSGRVSALSTGAGSIAYFPFGAAKSWTEPNGLTYARTFDKDGRITGIALGGTVNVQTLTYDNASRITRLTETGLSTKTYGYDSDDRLTDFVNGTATPSYTYDADGNRSSTITTAGTTTHHYPTTSNRLASLSGLTTQTETYDASGNQTGDGTGTYAYDARNRMSSANTGGITTSYVVNAFGERVRKIGNDVPNGEVNEYVYDEQRHLIGEYNSTGGIVNETVLLPETAISVLSNGLGIKGLGSSAAPVAVLTGPGGATTYSVSADWLNAPHIIQNASKENVWTWDHFAFGDNAPNQNPSDLGTFNYNLRFPGQHYDSESGLNYNLFRDYNPTLGRYAESDPVGLIVGINTYGYVRENPITKTDSLGMEDDPSGFTPVPLTPVSITNHTFSLGGQGFFLVGGGSGSFGFGYDSTGDVCIMGEVCSSYGVGLSVSVGGSASGGAGPLCIGRSTSVTVSVDGGDAYYGGLGMSYPTDPNSNGFGIFTLPPIGQLMNGEPNKGYGGVGLGGSLSLSSCTQQSYCINLHNFGF